MPEVDELTSTGVYAFCVIEQQKSKSFGAIEISGEQQDVYTVGYRDVAMVVAKAPLKIYPPKKENLLFHQSVVTRVMKEQTVVPVSFGNVFQSDDDVRVLLENLYDHLKELLPKLSNRIEVGLKVMGQKDWLQEEIHQNPKVEKLKQRIRGKSDDAAYYDRIQLGDIAQEFFSSMKHKCEEEIYRPLARISDAAKNNETVGERMLLNASFLIDREQETTFDEMVSSLYEDWQDRVEFKYTGPWPAYNFIQIKLKVAGAP